MHEPDRATRTTVAGPWLVFASCLLAVTARRPVAATPAVDPKPPIPSPAPPAPNTLTLPSPATFEHALDRDTDVLLLPAAHRPAPRPTVFAATRAKTSAHAVASVVLDPAAMREALPALVRADVVATRPGPRKDAWPDRLIAWEVEVPFFNLTGRAWLQQRDDGAELTLIEGAFAPGRVRLRAKPTADGKASIATCELQIEVRSANWIFRKVARHDPWAETAMTAATAWVLARAVVLRAETGRGARSPRPTGAITPPVADTLDGSPLAAPALAALRGAGIPAIVRRAPNGRLAWASVSMVVPGDPVAVASRLATPETWRVFPGWKAMKRRAQATPAPGAAPAPILIEVDDDIAFVDFDAVWSVAVTSAVRATAVGGDIRGAVFGWQTWSGDRPGTALAVLSMHPRLDKAGFIERRLIAAEPLLEHAFGIALTYVDAAAVADSLDRAPADR